MSNRIQHRTGSDITHPFFGVDFGDGYDGGKNTILFCSLKCVGDGEGQSYVEVAIPIGRMAARGGFCGCCGKLLLSASWPNLS